MASQWYAGIACAVAGLLAAAPAAAQDTVAHSRMVIRADGTVTYALKIPVEDLAGAIGSPEQTALNAQQVRGAEERLFDHFLPLITLSAGGRRCAAQRSGMDVPQAERLYGELRFRFSCPAGVPVTVDYRVFFDVDPGHVGTLDVEGPGGQARAEFSADKPRWEVNAGLTGPPQLRAYEAGGTRPPAPIAAAPPEPGAEAAPATTPLRVGRPALPKPDPGPEPRPRSHWLPAMLALVAVGTMSALIVVWRRRPRAAPERDPAATAGTAGERWRSSERPDPRR
jgi:hypothetical protein